MEAKQQPLCQFMEGHEKRFIIPVYQRNYDWKQEHCQQLYEDLMGIIEKKPESYFMGSIVSTLSDSYGNARIIIDGQQRLTTLSILLLTICHLLDDEEVTAEDKDLKEIIYETYLINKYNKDEKIRLKPVKNDNAAFEKLFDGDEEQYDASSNITSNYTHLKKKIKETVEQGKYTIDDFFDAFKKLMIVDIKLDPYKDNPHLIFESLNAAGKKLEQADLIRNFILMDKPSDVQEKLYEEYWLPIEKNTDYQVSDFIKNFLTYLSGRQPPRHDRVYDEFKKFLNSSIKNVEEALEEPLKLSKYYGEIILFSKTQNENINKRLKRIKHLEITVSYPFLLDLFHAWRMEEIITAEEVSLVLSHIEAFAFRRLICEIPPNSLNKIFPKLVKDIRKALEQNDSESYFNCFLYFLMQGSGNARFPIDSEFMGKIQERDIYNLKSKNRIHLFRQLEDFQNNESDIENLLAEGSLTTEHIMPKHLKHHWKEALGDNYRDIHEKYLNCLGNLTLTGYNSKYSDRPFIEKRDIENGFKESTLWLNRDIANAEDWTAQEIIARGKHLAKRALKIWPTPPKSTYQQKTEEQAGLSIFDDFNFTGTKPTQFTFLGDSHSVSSWVDLYMQTARKLDFLDASYFERIITQPDKARLASREEYALLKLIKPQKLRSDSNVCLETNLSAEGIIENLKLLFDENGVDEDDFEVVLKED